MASRSLVAAIGRGWRDPRGAMAEQLAGGLSEPRALFHLMLAVGLYFVASLPAALRTAEGLGRAGEVDDPMAATVAAHIFGYLFLLPLLAYGVAAALHLAARGFGGRAGFLGARAALFWAALLGAPVALAISFAGGLAQILGGDRLPLHDLLGYAGLAFWLWLLAATFAEAEGFGTLPVAIALATVLVLGGLALFGAATA